MQLVPIGIIRSPYTEPAGTPIQTAFGGQVQGTVEVFSQYREALADLAGFSHIILLYWFHKSHDYTLTCRPFLDTEQRGLFATRAPRRPNPIGLSVVELVSIDDGRLTIGSPDMLDGSPLLDIKPYIDTFDSRTPVRTGWYATAKNKSRLKADGRFAE